MDPAVIAGERNAILRRELLKVLYTFRGGPDSGYMAAELIHKGMNDYAPSQRRCTRAETLMLLRDLVAPGCGLAEQRDEPRLPETPEGIEHFSFRITTRGCQLIEEQIPAIPGVKDRRL
jgi:hypothetical protein